MTRFLLLAFCFLLLNFPGVSLQGQIFYRTGSPDDIQTNPLAGIIMAGGASDNDDAMRWFLERADGGDIVVIRANDSQGYNNYLYSSLGIQVNSVTTIVIASQAAANNQEVYDAIVNAEALFIAGGNQWNYINYWKNSLVHDALQHLITEKQVTIGGSSAGLAVLGEVVYSAQNGTVWSTEALGNPYHFRVTLVRDFLQIPFLENLVTDSHYNRTENDNHDRKGRHVAFMARMATDWQMDARGIGINEYTAVGVDENGLSRVFGNPAYDDHAYFIIANDIPEVCQEGQPLTWYAQGQALSVYRITGNPQGNNSFDLGSWQEASGGHWEYWFVQDGVLYSADPENTFQVRFEVLHGLNENPLQGARVELHDEGVLYTNNQGVAIFTGVSPAQDLSFEVSLTGYYNESGTVDVTNEDVNHYIFLYPDDGTSAEEVEFLNTLNLYPNPATSDNILVDIPMRATQAKLKVISSHGRLIMEKELMPGQTASESLDVSSWAPGVYLIIIQDNVKRWQARLVKM